eukprot:scaffold26444_cov104-Isochrysis_galbana.AAC.2
MGIRRDKSPCSQQPVGVRWDSAVGSPSLSHLAFNHERFTTHSPGSRVLACTPRDRVMQTCERRDMLARASY